MYFYPDPRQGKKGDAYSSTASRFSLPAICMSMGGGVGDSKGACRAAAFASLRICFFESRNARASSCSVILSLPVLWSGPDAILNAAFTSACATKPQCGHSNRLRVRLPNSPHRLHRLEVYVGFTYVTGIPRLCARLSTIFWRVKNDPFSNENSKG
jgi:hypothetical protein